MNMYLIILIVTIILVLVTWSICRDTNTPVFIDETDGLHESFVFPEMNINAAILFTVYKADKYDYEFVEKYYKDIPFYIVNNGAESEWFKKMKELPGVHTLTRENKGWDLAGWKAGMDKWNDQLSQYDSVAFVNNSCVYLFDVYSFFVKSLGYDMYGLTHCISPVMLYHVSTVFIAIGKNLYNSELFKQHWNGLRMDRKHNYVAIMHEWGFTKKLRKLGYRVGAYDTFNGGMHLYQNPDTKKHYAREFIKKTTMTHIKKKDLDKQIDILQRVNAENGYH